MNLKNVAKTIVLKLPIWHKYDLPYDFPCKKVSLEINGLDLFVLEIDLKTGKILHDAFPENFQFKLELKVCDSGDYILLDENRNPVGEIVENYVPDCVPNDYGDVVVLDIDNGFVTNWVEPTKFKEFNKTK